MPTEVETADVQKLLGEVTERVGSNCPTGMLVVEFHAKRIEIGHTDNMQPFAEMLREMFAIADKVGHATVEATKVDEAEEPPPSEERLP